MLSAPPRVGLQKTSRRRVSDHDDRRTWLCRILQYVLVCAGFPGCPALHLYAASSYPSRGTGSHAIYCTFLFKSTNHTFCLFVTTEQRSARPRRSSSSALSELVIEFPGFGIHLSSRFCVTAYWIHIRPLQAANWPGVGLRLLWRTSTAVACAAGLLAFEQAKQLFFRALFIQRRSPFLSI